MGYRQTAFRLPVLLLLSGANAACSGNDSSAGPIFKVPELQIELPKLSGWTVDPTIKTEDLAKGGVVFRLVRESPVPMSPRIDVYLETLKTRPTNLEEFLTENLREIARLESGGSIRITQVEKRPLKVGMRPGYHVLHEYAMLTPGQAPIAITQISAIFVLNGRGVAITAAGRTELFHPLAESIERILTGVALPIPTDAADLGQPGGVLKPRPGGLGPGIGEPVDLGKVGGQH
ncbi:MAG: hypothetical protein HY903_01505 [Deltaproteobacteria bacterium]|nr:hypothetical protein [Deltaproteobacteria bacterium]